MTILAAVLLGAAALITLLLQVLASQPRAHGPDAAGQGIVFPILSGPRWICLAVVLGIVLARGGFAWIGGGRGVQAAVVYGVHAVAGVLSILSLMLRDDFDEKLVHAGAVVFGGVMPILVMIYAAAALVRPPGEAVPALPLRVAVALGAALTAVGVVCGLQIHARTNRDFARHRDESEKKAQDAHREKEAELEALAPNAPLVRYMAFLSLHGDEADIGERAAKYIAARPTLVADLTALLSTDDRLEALKYIWVRMPEPPAELAVPMRDSMAGLVEWSRRRLADPATAVNPGIDDACEASIVLEHQFKSRGSTVDFATPLKELQAFLEANPVDATLRARSLLKDWASGNIRW